MASLDHAGPQFSISGGMASAGGSDVDKTGRFSAEYMAYHLDPSGGVNHSGVFDHVDHANKWAADTAVAGTGSHADERGEHMLSGYSVHRRVRDGHTGSYSNWSSMGGGHITVSPLKPGAKPDTRSVTGQHVGHSFNPEGFRKKSAEMWQQSQERRRKG